MRHGNGRDGARDTCGIWSRARALFMEATMPNEPNGVEPDKSEDDIQRERLGPRGVPGKEDPAKMTPQREKKTPKNVDPGHTA